MRDPPTVTCHGTARRPEIMTPSITVPYVAHLNSKIDWRLIRSNKSFSISIVYPASTSILIHRQFNFIYVEMKRTEDLVAGWDIW